jgi:hypothetical protein
MWSNQSAKLRKIEQSFSRAIQVLEKPRHESPSSLINLWIIDHTFQILGIKKTSKQGSVKSFAKFSLLQSHRHGQFFRPLDPILFSAPMVRRRSVSLPSLFPRPRSRHRDLTGRPLSSPVWPLPDRSASPYLSRLGWPLRFRWGIKRETLPRCFYCQVSPAFELNSVAALVFPFG